MQAQGTEHNNCDHSQSCAGVWLGEAAQTLTCNVDFEIPAVKKASARAQQQLVDLQRRRKEFLHSAMAAAAAYAQVRLGFCVVRHVLRQRDGRRGRPCSGVCLAAMRTASVSLLRKRQQVSGKLAMCGRQKLEIQATSLQEVQKGGRQHR